jgi:hypothetical protein
VAVWQCGSVAVCGSVWQWECVAVAGAVVAVVAVEFAKPSACVFSCVAKKKKPSMIDNQTTDDPSPTATIHSQIKKSVPFGPH